MSSFTSGSEGADKMPQLGGWGDVPPRDRMVWCRYMVDHLPSFPGATVMAKIASGERVFGRRMPSIWKDTARTLHAVGFTPIDYYLLAELITTRIDALDIKHHAQLFELWPARGERNLLTFQVNPAEWATWLDQVRIGVSPRSALDWVLSGVNLNPMGGLCSEDGEETTIVS